MQIKLTRIDERLVHGQVAYSWTVKYDVDYIMIVDDEAASNELNKTLISLAVPKGKDYGILSLNDAAVKLKSDNSNKKTFIVVAHPKVILELVKAGVDIHEVNVGGLYFKEGRKKFSKTVYLSDEEIDIFQQLKEKNVACEIRTSPNDKSIDLFSLI